ncbi:MAG TPA: SpoIIE family protein phosphatase [Candidatus Rifleibacterium sp.]|nr:SpoIIE family protein phosphatase [Candidatus Rifleibacterium sp.]HPT45086.1 SpoIIE family protein phosphatase [Candidatus Rifleibacterium sp.]
MTSENPNRQSYGNRLLRWLLLVACLVGIPATLVFTAATRYYQVAEEELAFNLRMQMQQVSNDAIRHTSQEEFWCRHFHEKFVEFRDANASPAVIISWLQEQRRQFTGEFDFIFWDKTGSQLAKSFSGQYSDEDWHEVFGVLSNFGAFLTQISYRNVIKGRMATARKVLGPQTISAMFNGILDPRNYSLAWLDSAKVKPPVASYFLECGATLILFNHNRFNEYSGMKRAIGELAKQNELLIGIIDNAKEAPTTWQTDGRATAPEFLQAFSQCELQSLNFVELPGHYLAYQYLSPPLRLFSVVPKHLVSSQIMLRAALLTAGYLLLMMPFLNYTRKTMIDQQPGKVSIRRKLAFLFLFASGFPLLAMAIISQEHYSHQRHTLMAEAHHNSVEMLLSFDRRYSSSLKDIGLALDRFFIDWSRKAANKTLDYNMINTIASQLAPMEIQNFFMVASNTRVIGGINGCVHYSGSLEDIKINLASSTLYRKMSTYVHADFQTANLVGKKVMSDLNRVEMSGQSLDKLEIVAESLLQKSFIEITHSIIESIGHIDQWGFGYLKDLTYFKFLSVVEPGLSDYLAMVFWQPQTMQNAFLRTALPQANRNSAGFRLYAFNRLSNSFTTNVNDPNNILKDFARRAGQKPSEEIEIIKILGEEYLAVGFSGRHLEFFQMIGLYPMHNIDLIISGQKSDMLLYGLFSILLAAGLAQLLSSSFVAPLSVLREGALAIENRNFSHRIKDAGNDEFGEVAGIFNHIMVGFEELEVAKIVQESLFPKPEFELNRFKVYGRSISMGELGGDYLDFFKIDDTGFAVLMGDVAGHGVGAALIMAMAKAGILSSGDQLTSPQAVLSGLHRMVLASKSSRQKKVMTFQYLFMNSTTGAGLYGNAGACSPFIYRHQRQTIEELKQNGAALGAFKKAVYHEMPVQLDSGDAIIFYTDGIVESRNRNGEETGYEGLQVWLKESYNPDPALYYQNIFARYTAHIAGQEAQDDLTLIIMICS